MNWIELKEIFEQEINIAKEKYPDIQNHFSDRCIGIVSKEEWEKVRTTHIAILGAGGLGMPLLELLVRSGAETLTIVDKDIIDPTNMNRVQFAFPFTYDQKKTEVAEIFLRLINPNVKIRKFETVTSENVAEIFDGVEVATLTLDGLHSSLIASKYMHEHGIPFIEGWALAGVLNVRHFLPDGPSYEEVYNLNISKDYDAITAQEWKTLNTDFFMALDKLSREIANHYTSDGLRFMLDGGPRRSFPAFVWIISTIMASELIFKLILKRNFPQKTAPNILLYDYLCYNDLGTVNQKKNLREQISGIISNGGSAKEKTTAIMKLFL